MEKNKLATLLNVKSIGGTIQNNPKLFHAQNKDFFLSYHTMIITKLAQGWNFAVSFIISHRHLKVMTKVRNENVLYGNRSAFSKHRGSC